LNFVQPIRDPEVIKDMEIFFNKRNPRNFILFILGIYTGLRVSDLLSLRVSDLKDKSYLVLKEKKTKKSKRIKIHPHLKRVLPKYLEGKDPREFIIKSRNGKNKPITRERAYSILKEAANEFGLDAIGTHTLRKTFGYHLYQQTKDVALLQELFNHAAPSITLRYIGVNQDTMDTAIMKFRYH
jgi:integrase